MIHHYSGASIKELKAKYGTGSNGFWKQDWYENETFYTEKLPAGQYEIELRKDLVNKTYDEQAKKVSVGWEVTHPAIVLEAILEHYTKTKERLLENWNVWTSSRYSDGNFVCVGGFVPGGMRVIGRGPWHRDGRLGVSLSRKLDTLPVEPSDLLVTEIEYRGRKYKLV